MQKFKFMFALLLCAFIAGISLASVNASEQQTAEDTESLIISTTESYLKEKGVNATAELSYEDIVLLNKKIDQIKENDPELIDLKNGVNTRAISEYRGYVFVTGDSKTSGWSHGHAGIGSATPESVIEANPGDGVKPYYNRIANYWSKVNSSIMAVRGATSTHYHNAFAYANSQYGKPYGLDPFDGADSYFCSELVRDSWYNAGISVAGNTNWVFPHEIYQHANTIAVKKYGSGY